MITAPTSQQTPSHSDSSPKTSRKSFHNVIEKTYQSNLNSDYTEKIDSLRKTFAYDSNSQVYWGDPELSVFYGTPLYEQASEAQKLALNHLYWVSQYYHTAAAEANTMLYNQVTCGVFEKLGGYDTLCQELAFETSQEKFHVNTFQKVGYRTKLALLGKDALIKPVQKFPATSRWELSKLGVKSKLEAVQETTFRSVTKLMFQRQSAYYSRFLEEQEGNHIPTTSGGLAGVTASRSAFKFLTLNWGSSPFMAAQYYSARMIANMSLKTYEHSYFKRFRELKKRGEFIPTPLAISYYHLLDESYHTTMSQVISQRLYKDFRPPNPYETALANLIIFRLQKGLMGGLSGAMPAVFRHDAPFIAALYRILTSQIFEFSQTDALTWLESCLCHEHEGFHVNRRYHQMLLTDLQRFFAHLGYLWPVNREMQLMGKGDSIGQALKTNHIALKTFAQSLV